MCSGKYFKCLAVGFVCCHVVISTHTGLKTNFTRLLTLFGLHGLMSFTCLLHSTTDSPCWVCPFVTILHSLSSNVTSAFPSFSCYFYFLTFASMCMYSFTSPFFYVSFTASFSWHLQMARVIVPFYFSAFIPSTPH